LLAAAHPVSRIGVALVHLPFIFPAAVAAGIIASTFCSCHNFKVYLNNLLALQLL
jgi:hypothetical protein